MTLIRENLKLTPTERLEKLQKEMRLVAELSELGIEVTDVRNCGPAKIEKLERILEIWKG